MDPQDDETTSASSIDEQSSITQHGNDPLLSAGRNGWEDVMLLIHKWFGDEKTGWRLCQRAAIKRAPMFWPQSWNQNTHTHLEAAQTDLCQHSWVPVLSSSSSCSSRCVCPTSSSFWSAVTERVPATSTSNHILSVTQRQEVLHGKKKVGGPQKFVLSLPHQLRPINSFKSFADCFYRRMDKLKN